MPQLPGEFCDAKFSGQVRLFPLPGLVVFPNVVQALHVFEPRYRQMLADSLQDDQLIAMATLADGWQGDYDGQPPLHSRVCLGKVTSHSMLEDGCSNILLVGLRRARIINEVPSDRLYRMAKIELIQDEYLPECDGRRCQLQQDLLEGFKDLMPSSAMVVDQLTQVMAGDASLGVLTDLISYSLQLPTDAKQELLGQRNVDERARFLLSQISSWAEDQSRAGSEDEAWNGDKRPGFPPDFSSN